MGFEALERLLQEALRSLGSAATAEQKKRVREQILSEFVRKSYEKAHAPLWKRMFSFRAPALAIASMGIIVLFNAVPFVNSYLSAGQVTPRKGLVELERNGKISLVRDKTLLKVGDVVRVGSSAEAEIVLPKKLVSVAKNKASLRIVDRDELFLEQGKLEAQSVSQGAVSTNRGQVQPRPGANFDVEVSESGETKISSVNATLDVIDWQHGASTVEAGEILSLRTDTRLSQKNIPSDLTLSTSQLLAIKSKFIIARTKILNGLERGDATLALGDFDSAEKTFRSTAQILKAGRNLELATTKENLDLIKNEDVLDRLAKKTDNADLLKEARAVLALLTLARENPLVLPQPQQVTAVDGFDRFTELDRIFALAPSEDVRALGEFLKDRYVAAFLRSVQKPEIRIEQLAILNRAIETLPRSEQANEFIIRTAKALPTEIGDMALEKAQTRF